MQTLISATFDRKLLTHVLLAQVLLVNLPSSLSLSAAEPTVPELRIGYTEFQTNLTGGRHYNIRTMRACVVSSTGAGRQVVAPELADVPDSWTQFAGWSPDGNTAIIGRGWQSPENADWEEQHKTFRFQESDWQYDTHLVNLLSETTFNVTAVDRVSFYNSGVFYWPGNPKKLGFTALIGGNSHPFSMSTDGHNKTDLTKESGQFAYGFSSSRDGSRISYHSNYQICLANADGSGVTELKTGNPFNFAPVWSPDGKWLLFVSGEHYNCHPFIVSSDGTGLRKLADRGGYRGVTEFLDVPDFHGGSSDVPIWAADSQSIFYTCLVGENIELFQCPLTGTPRQLTSGEPGTTHYHPQLSPDGGRLVYGSRREGVRQLFVRDLQTDRETQITNLKTGYAGMWPHWQPSPARNTSDAR